MWEDCGTTIAVGHRLRIATENRIKHNRTYGRRRSKTLCIVCPVVLIRHPPTVCGTGFFGRERSLVRVFLWLLFWVFWQGVRTQSEHYKRVRLQRALSCVMKRKQKNTRNPLTRKSIRLCAKKYTVHSTQCAVEKNHGTA